MSTTNMSQMNQFLVHIKDTPKVDYLNRVFSIKRPILWEWVVAVTHLHVLVGDGGCAC